MRHREDVRVADRDNVDASVKIGLDHSGDPALNLIRVDHRGVLRDHPGEDFELVFLRIVQTLVDRRHHFHAALKQSHRRADGGLLVHVARLHVSDVDEAATRLDQELSQRCRRFFVRQWDDCVTDVAPGSVHVPELSGLQGFIAIADTDAFSLETRREVGKCACVDQLT